MMGCVPSDSQCDDNEKPQHKVKITKPFYMGMYEVTQKEWEAVMGENPAKFKESKGCFFWNIYCESPDYPVESVSWYQIQEFIQKLNAASVGNGRDRSIQYRLPTEAEWEYAARAGSETTYYWGDSIGKSNANCMECGSLWGGQRTSSVGSFAPNAFGLYDMLGNVWEWTGDWYDINYYENSPKKDPLNDKQSDGKVLRGGSWNDVTRDLRVSYRNNYYPSSGNFDIGFRLVASSPVESSENLPAH